MVQVGSSKRSPPLSKFLNPDGTFNSAAVAACDEGLQRVMRDGLDMEVLSWKMMIEEPTAASLISQALNTAHNMALHTSELTALSVLSGAVGEARGSAVAGQVCFETIRGRVRMELDMCVDQAGFIDLFEFVVNMRGEWKSLDAAVGGVWVQVRRPKAAPVEPSGFCRG